MSIVRRMWQLGMAAGMLLAVTATAAPEDDIAMLQGRVRDLRAKLDKALPADSPVAIHIAMRLRWQAWSLERQDPYYWSPGSTAETEYVINEVAKVLDKAIAGDPIFQPGKTFIMGYLSELDDTWQAWQMWIPREYEAQKPLPLLVWLHGWDMFSPWQSGAPGVEGWIVVGAQGRGGTDYKFIGEADVVRVVREVQKVLKVDTSRIVLGGASMGGTGAWQVATHYPDIFTGILPVCGNTDVNVWRRIWDWRTPALSPQKGVRDFLEDETSPTAYAENLLGLAILAFHGEADPINNIGHAANMLSRLRTLQHPDCRVHLLPYVGHGISVDLKPALESLAPRRVPAKLSWRTAWLKYPGAYWLQVNGLEQRLTWANINAEYDPVDRVIRAETANITELALLASELPKDARPERAVLDNQPLPLGKAQVVRRTTALAGEHAPAAQGWLFHRNPGAPWQPGGKTRPSGTFPPRKTAYVEGPVEHALMSRFLVVAGDGGDLVTAAAGLKASYAAAVDFVNDWKTRYAYPCRMKKASDLIDEDLDESNLILFGNPEENAVTAKVVTQLPVRFAKGRLALGEQWYGGANVGIKLCYPNPLNANRYVVVVAGSGPDSYRDINRRFGNWFDWVACDYRQFYDFAVYDDTSNGRQPETFITWGYFGEEWQLDERLTFRKVDAWRQAQQPRAPAPKPLSAFLLPNGAAPKALFLDELDTKKVTLYKEYIERNRALDGRPLLLAGKPYKRGVASRFPCTLTFDCQGFRRFTATAGIFWDGISDPCLARKKSELVLVRATADGKELFRAEEQTYRKAPLAIDVELKGAKELTLHVGGGLFWLNDTFVWADACLSTE